MRQPDVVIDKSFLQGASRDQLRSLFERHRVLMTEKLFYELLTTCPAVRARCFKRIFQIGTPMIPVQNVTAILRWEVKNQRSLTSIDNVVEDKRFRFNPGLADKDFKFGEKDVRAIEKWNQENSVRVHDFAYHCSKVPVRFPALKGYHPGTTPTTQIEEIKKRLCA